MYTDLLTRIKNGQAVKRETVKIPYAQMDAAILEILERYGYIETHAKKGRTPKRILEVKLSYTERGGAIHGLKFLSKPGRTLYAGYQSLPSVKQGHGLLILSTSKGIMTSHEAKKERLGGKLLFEIW